MADDLQDRETSGFNLEMYLGIVRRRHMMFLVLLLVGWFAVWGASWLLPSTYKSTTLILVEQPTMPKDYVTPNVNDDLQQRVQSITQQILSRTRLLHIVDQLSLYNDPRHPMTADDKVERMRHDIDIELVRNQQNEVSAFNVSFVARDPYVAQRVTNELTALFINENLEVRQQQSEDTTHFLEGQLETARQALAEQEDKIRQFKGQHVGELPTQTGSNLQILAGFQSQLQSDEDALNTAKQQRAYLETMVNQYRTMQGSSHAGTSSGGSMGLSAIDAELDRLRAQLADLSSRYTDRHPDVRKLKDQIAKTEKTREQLIAGLQANNSSAQSDSANSAPEAGDLRDSPMVQLQGQLRANKVEIANHEHSIAEIKGKISDYQARLNTEPIREQQLADLTRGYEQSKSNYDELLKKKNESAMATSMERLQQGERFRIIDPPSLPLKPDFPKRMRFCMLGLVFGLVLGALVVGGFEYMDDRIHDEALLKSALPVPVMSEIPAIATPADERRQRRRLWLGWATAGFVSVTILVGSALSYLRG